MKMLLFAVTSYSKVQSVCPGWQIKLSALAIYGDPTSHSLIFVSAPLQQKPGRNPTNLLL
jgi:hypothetical protein